MRQREKHEAEGSLNGTPVVPDSSRGKSEVKHVAWRIVADEWCYID